MLAVTTGLILASAVVADGKDSNSNPNDLTTNHGATRAVQQGRVVTTKGAQGHNSGLQGLGSAQTSAQQAKSQKGPATRDHSGVKPGQGGIAGANPACPNPTHDCYTSGSVGCSDETCCNAVCDCDPFCCSVAWDVFCATTGYAPDCQCPETGCGAINICGAPPGPANDNCADRIMIGVGPVAFNTTGATTDGPETACNTSGDPQINQDIWYNFIAPSSGFFSASLCGSGYDTKIAVYDGCACPDPCASDITGDGVTNTADLLQVINNWGPCPGCPADITGDGIVNTADLLQVINHWGPCGPGLGPELACNDDFCGLQSQIAWDAVAGQCYKVRVGGYLAATGGGTLDIEPPCITDCPPGSIQEGEDCGLDTNGGCNSTPPVYTQIACGQTVCGSAWASGGTRDTDWYQFSVTEFSEVHWSVTASFPAVAFILNNNCGNIVLLAQGTGNCPVEAIGQIQAGTYVAFAATAGFDGTPCGTNNAYFATLTCGPGVDPCGDPNNHPCDQEGGPGCSDHDCCAAVCAVDTFCCATAWDSICVGEAACLCAPAPVNDNCADRLLVAEGDTPFNTCGATTDGPPTACIDVAGDDQVQNDIWFNFFAPTTDLYSASTCGSALDTKMAVYEGCTCPPGLEVGCNDDACQLQSIVSWNAAAGTCYKIRIGGFNGAAGSGNLHIQAGLPPGPCDDPNNHACNVAGGPGCNDQTCCLAVCAVDPFCCDVSWDGICVSEAISICGLPGPCDDPNNHPCDVEGGPGCADHDCCTTVCSVDPFCCQSAWDSICVGEAASFCGPPCPTDCPAGSIQEGEDCGFDTNGGCNSTPAVYSAITCGQTVCGSMWASGGTRDTDWYMFTTAADATVTWSVFVNTPAVAFLLNNDCGNIVLLAQGAGNCPIVASTFLSAGTYVAFTATGGFDGLPCGDNNAYYATLTCK